MIKLSASLRSHNWEGYPIEFVQMEALLEDAEQKLVIFKDDYSPRPSWTIHLFSNVYMPPPLVQIHPYNTEDDIVELIKIWIGQERFHVPIHQPNPLMSIMSEHELFVLLDGLGTITHIVNGTAQDFESCSLDKKRSQELYKFFHSKE
jgi:hypothetical protein